MGSIHTCISIHSVSVTFARVPFRPEVWEGGFHKLLFAIVEISSSDFGARRVARALQGWGDS
jgi:hypothetical protein